MIQPCTQRERLPNEPGGLGGAGGDGADRPDAGGSAGESGSGGTASVAGEGPAGGDGGSAGSDGGGALAIQAIPLAGNLCAGADLSVGWRASGGVSPWSWRVLEAPGGLTASPSDGAELVISGVPAEPGPLRVELQDASGARAVSETLNVSVTPEIETQSVPVLCAGATYAVDFEASGGAQHVWSASLLDDAGEARPLELLGLAVVGSRLVAEQPVPEAAAGSFRLVLGVREAGCRSRDVELELPIASLDDVECPSIAIAGAPSDGELPSPCLGNRYSEALEVEGGTPPYTWTELAAPPGLHFDPGSVSIDGIAEGDGVLSVSVSDGEGRSVEQSYSVDAREACWLAYVASEPAPPRLELVDARLLARQPDNARRTLPVEPSAEAAIDFAFSPDGRFIAYRLGADPSAPRLELARVLDGQSLALDVAGGVLAYAWSKDASTLAAVVSTGAVLSLQGLDVSEVDTSVAAAGDALAGVRRLDAIELPGVDSSVAAQGARGWAFLSRAAGALGRRRLVTVARSARGFAPAAVRGELDFSDAAHLFGAAAGTFVADPETGLQQFFPSAGAGPVPHAPGAVLSTSGALVGIARDGLLQVHEPSVASEPLPAAAGALGCSTLLTWASARQRVACADARAGDGALALFDVAASGATTPAGARAGAGIPAGGYAGHPRRLSSGGRWLAVSTADVVNVWRADGAAGEPVLVLPSAALGTAAAALAFSPDESALAIGAGNSLGLVDLDQGASSFRIASSSAVFGGFCSESFIDGAQQFCGGEGTDLLSWSSGSDLLAFRTSLGTLAVIERTEAPASAAPLSPDPVCAEACSSAFSARFQP